MNIRLIARVVLASVTMSCLPAQNCNAEDCNADGGAERSKPPNVVLFLADDLGWTGLSCFGSDFYQTPHLDALASEGLKFTDADAACTVCSPTRASVMTGMYPARLRCTDFIAGQNRPFAKLKIPDWTRQLESRHVTIAEALQSAGYRSGHFGKWHLEDKGDAAKQTGPLSQGFDVSVSRPRATKGYLMKSTKSRAGTNYLTDWLTDAACDFIEDSKDEPFFLYFAYNVPHTPIQGREDLVQQFAAKVDPGATHKNPIYAAMVASMDQSVGRVLAQLETLDLAEDTLVIFTSDNGGLTQRFGKHDGFTENLPLRRGKGSAYEGGVRVPTIVSWPGVTTSHTVCDQPIMTIDYYPTILEAAGVEVANDSDAAHRQNIDGRSLVPLLRDPKSVIDRNLYWHYPHYHAGGDSPYSAVRSGNLRLIEFHEDDSVRLYDLDQDLGEQHDQSGQQADKAAALRADLHRWRQSVDAQMPTPNPDFDPAKETTVLKRRPATSRK